MAPATGQSPPGTSRSARRVVAVVLAAGASSRMGRPKALLEFDGSLCLELVAAACAGAGVDELVLVTSPGGGDVRRVLPGALQAINEHPEQGMLSSLQAGLRALPPGTAGFLLFPVDFPLVPAVEIRRLRGAFAAGGGLIFVPSYARRRGHPVLMDARLAPELLGLDAAASARAVMAAHEQHLVYVEADDDRVLMDMDTPDDYGRCLARHRSGS
jgi:molybdenum cofactor cytidylyltransferase